MILVHLKYFFLAIKFNQLGLKHFLPRSMLLRATKLGHHFVRYSFSEYRIHIHKRYFAEYQGSKTSRVVGWNKEESKKLVEALWKCKPRSWSCISKFVTSKSPRQCRFRVESREHIPIIHSMLQSIAKGEKSRDKFAEAEMLLVEDPAMIQQRWTLLEDDHLQSAVKTLKSGIELGKNGEISNGSFFWLHIALDLNTMRQSWKMDALGHRSPRACKSRYQVLSAAKDESLQKKQKKKFIAWSVEERDRFVSIMAMVRMSQPEWTWSQIGQFYITRTPRQCLDYQRNNKELLDLRINSFIDAVFKRVENSIGTYSQTSVHLSCRVLAELIIWAFEMNHTHVQTIQDLVESRDFNWERIAAPLKSYGISSEHMRNMAGELFSMGMILSGCQKNRPEVEKMARSLKVLRESVSKSLEKEYYVSQ